MSEFVKALVDSDNQSDSGLNLFGQFVGEWDFDWYWYGDGDSESHDTPPVKGEWLFSWILERSAIQDVWICPSREERTRKAYPYTEYGTSTRFYNKENGEWNVFYGCANDVAHLKVIDSSDTSITLEVQHVGDVPMRWVFTDITQKSFTWQNTRSEDNGKTFKVQGQLHATRREMG
ncbi:MAG: hypothetical protein FWG45_03455 [Oscillospiraceae bacterium]|nr:hypothetical protein [Oscillospiraceae bacterium]